jgi:hypothetical protein
VSKTVPNICRAPRAVVSEIRELSALVLADGRRVEKWFWDNVPAWQRAARLLVLGRDKGLPYKELKAARYMRFSRLGCGVGPA